jgi:hypothetical protein
MPLDRAKSIIPNGGCACTLRHGQRRGPHARRVVKVEFLRFEICNSKSAPRIETQWLEKNPQKKKGSDGVGSKG